MCTKHSDGSNASLRFTVDSEPIELLPEILEHSCRQVDESPDETNRTCAASDVVKHRLYDRGPLHGHYGQSLECAVRDVTPTVRHRLD